MAKVRFHTICTTASPQDTVANAEKVADLLRANGEHVRISEVFWMPEGTRKAGLPAIQLEVSDEPFTDIVVAKKVETATGAAATVTEATVPTPAVTQTTPERPMSFQEMDARDREQARIAALPENQPLVSDDDIKDEGFPNERQEGVLTAPKRRGGRPKGSKNRSKAVA